ncbi:MAG: energy transducer TonB [Flavobacteriaceae bacterium]
MKVQKTKPSVNLQKSSILFLQLGLILAMFSVYVILEHESYYEIEQFRRVANVEENEKPLNYVFLVEPKKRKIPKKKVLKTVTKKPVTKNVADKIKVVKNDDIKKVEAIFKSVDIDDPITPLLKLENIPSVDGNDVDSKEAEEPVPFIKVEIAPTFPGCEKEATNEGRIACFNNKINKHINKKFDGELVQEIGLEPGKKRISVQFVIDKFGEITQVKVNAPHVKLDKETRRILKTLPKMIPARQRLNNVPVQYSLPILISVEEE